MRALSIGSDWFTADEDAVLLGNYGKVARRHLMSLLPSRTWEGIRARAKKLKLTTIGKGDLCSLSRLRHSHSERFFSDPNPMASYYAGLIAADGCVRYRTLSLSLTETDGHLVQAFAGAVGYTGPVRWRACGGGIKPQKWVTISGATRLISDLNRHYSITPRKSLTLLPPPNLDRTNTLAFIVGYIDGDGSMGNYGGYFRLSMRGTKEVLTWIVAHLESLSTDLDAKSKHRKAKVEKYPSDHTFSYFVSGRRAVAMCRGLMAIALPRLERKWSLVPID